MNILACMVTHNRLEYTRRAVDAWMATRHTSDHLLVVDNASTDGTREWLNGCVDATFNTRNLFPGAATNIGWHRGLQDRPDTTHLMRLDNDVELLEGWRDEIERCFRNVPGLGILGILNRHEDYDNQQPVTLDPTGTVNVHWDQVGGNCIIPRRWWDQGLRWKPGAWQPGGQDEDSDLAAHIRERGGLVGTVVPTVANNMSFHRFGDYPDYYRFTAGVRGLVPELSV